MNKALTQTENLLLDIRQGNSFSLGSVSEIVTGFIDSLSVSDDLVRHALHSKDKPLDIPSHLLNVCVFALEIGKGLLYTREELEKLGMAAILHDIGMTKVPENILKKPGRLSKEEFDIVKRHPAEGVSILKHLSGNNGLMSEVIMQEHERFDGTGYPRGLKGNEIHDFAYIIGIADIYEALTHHRFQRKNLLPMDSMQEILLAERHSFPEKIIKALLSKLPVFPAGTLVRLSSQEIGVVISSDNTSPFRPTVEIILDPSGRKQRKDKIINLKNSHLLYIISLVSEEEINFAKSQI